MINQGAKREREKRQNIHLLATWYIGTVKPRTPRWLQIESKQTSSRIHWRTVKISVASQARDHLHLYKSTIMDAL